MSHRDEFDESGSSGMLSSIFSTLDSRNTIKTRRPFVAAGTVLALALVTGTVLWYSYPKEKEKQELGAVPIVRADAEPYKVVPNEPGGMEIAHRDSTVFETLRDGEERRVESLLPESEKPLARESLFAGLNTTAEPPVADITAEPESEPAFEDAPRFAEVAPAALAEPEAPVEVAEAPVVPAPPAEDIEVAKAEEVAKTEPAAGVETFGKNKYDAPATHFVQLMSVKSEADAKTGWSKMQKQFSKQLGDLGFRVQKADLGARGVYYRLQAGPVAEAQAKSICNALKGTGGCVVVKR